MTVRPIKANEIQTEKAKVIPETMIEAANQLLVENINPSGTRATFKFKELKRRYKELVAGKGATEDEINEVKVETWWLDIEDTYRENGWNVNVDCPAYNESYDGYYEFTIKTKTILVD